MTKILLVDDEESIRNIMRMTLELDGYDVFLADGGRQALEIFHKETPDLVLLDVRMPEMDGLTVLRKMKEVRPEAEVIMMTGHGDMQMAVECLRNQASDFLAKPISDELLSFSLRRSEEKLTLKRKLQQYTRNLETLVREANLELERSYQFRENLIENSPDAIVCIRKGGEIVIFNSAAEKLLNYKKSEVIKKLNIVNVYPPGLAKQVMKDLRSESFGGPGVLQKRELMVLHRDGTRIPVYISAAILYEGGKEAGSVGIFTDLRERKTLEAQLLRTEKLSSLGKMAAGIAHEINQPLTGILTFASILKKKFEDDPTTGGDLEVIVRETTRIRRIVTGVLDFARETPMKKRPVDLKSLLEQTLEIIVHQELFFGVELKKGYSDNIPQVTIDESQMQQVFMNVFLNALDAMDNSGVLTVRTSLVDKQAVVEISDTGRGIPEDMLGKIFDPFFTTKDSSEGMGMGLGLAVSYGIVNSHSGDIEVKSQKGVGTTFSIKLPLE